MPWIETSELTPGTPELTAWQAHQTYCGLDSCVTWEVREALRDLGPEPQIYAFTRALQAPYLEIMQRGFRIDETGRRRAAEELRKRQAAYQARLDELALVVWDRPLNPRSQPQLQEFFYKKLRLPEVWISQKGQRKLSLNREVLEKLDEYLYARPFIGCILAIREIAKQLEVFETEIDADLRYRAGYNITGTETGRPSSSTNAFGTAGNAQNIAQGLRYVFVADEGFKLVVIDLEQVEARDVGFFCGCLFDDWTFLDSCELGDLHTNNAKRIWPELPWPGEPRGDRALADQVFYRDFTYRDMAKRGSHLSNYFGTAWTASRHLKVPVAMMEEFQARYVRGREAQAEKFDSRGRLVRPALAAIAPAFPCIPRWWQWTAEQLQTRRTLTTPFGRTRQFFGRPEDDTTLREAIAFLPQSTTADRMNLGLWRVWRHMPQVELLAQTYDSITFQVPERQVDSACAEALERIRVELVAPNGRRYVVPGEAKVGWNWGGASRSNPDGLLKWKPGADRRQRTRGLDRLAG